MERSEGTFDGDYRLKVPEALRGRYDQCAELIDAIADTDYQQGIREYFHAVIDAQNVPLDSGEYEERVLAWLDRLEARRSELATLREVESLKRARSALRGIIDLEEAMRDGSP